ncbi:MAG: maleylpyruvate isomerase family mycothiol-dependent enzyme [Jatrophihabitans sp.]
MDIPELIDQLESDGPLLVAAAERAGWDAPVPGTEWDVRTLVTHVGGVHRWAADAIRTSSQNYQSAAGAAVGTGPGDDELLAWFASGHASLVAALRAAPDDLATFTFLPADSPRHFWARRQAHETAIHRVDAEGASGAVTDFSAGVAQDGIAELLHGFAQRKSNAPDATGSFVLKAHDGPSWRIDFGGERIAVESAAEFGWANGLVSGTSSDLYRWLWNRPSPAMARGTEAVFALWRTVQVRWG